jgi:hypothetical protein
MTRLRGGEFYHLNPPTNALVNKKHPNPTGRRHDVRPCVYSPLGRPRRRALGCRRRRPYNVDADNCFQLFV